MFEFVKISAAVSDSDSAVLQEHNWMSCISHRVIFRIGAYGGFCGTREGQSMEN